MSATESRYNRWYRYLRHALELQRHEVRDILALAGLTVSTSRIDGWSRPETDTGRRTLMCEEEFDALLRGLPVWLKQQEAELAPPPKKTD